MFEFAGGAVQKAVADCGMPKGTFSLPFAATCAVGKALVADRRIKADVGFSGSRNGGTALMAIAAARLEPIPVYAEMSSINPVILFPGELSERGEAIGKASVASRTLGAGQFCANPGLILAVESEGLVSSIADAEHTRPTSASQTMLTPAIHKTYCSGVEKFMAHSQATKLAEDQGGEAFQGRVALLAATGADALKHPELQEEVLLLLPGGVLS